MASLTRTSLHTLALCALAFACKTAFAAPSTHPESYETVDAALTAARAAHEPILVDFSAIWCHACWWMKNNVMLGPQWDSLMDRVVYVEADSDLPDGAQWMEKLKVPGLPTYVVLNADGKELGRIVGEAKTEDFYPKLDHMVAGTDTLDALRAKALKGDTSDVAAVLDTYAARYDKEGALAWYSTLPASVRAKADSAPKIVLNLESMRMDQDKRIMMAEKNAAAKAALAKSCLAHGQHALAASPEYDDLVQLIDGLSDCSDGMDVSRRHAALDAPLKQAMAQLDAEKLSKHPLPPGTREAVIYLAETKKALGEKEQAAAIYERGIAAYRKQMDDSKGGLDLKKDRSAGDDLYALYRFSEQKDATRALLRQLAQDYSDDCNYSLAYGSLLLKENHADEALTYLERAAASAHGRYVLRVANARAKALIALSRKPEAEKVAAEALHASGSAFPKDQEALKKVIGTPSTGDKKTANAS